MSHTTRLSVAKDSLSLRDNQNFLVLYDQASRAISTG